VQNNPRERDANTNPPRASPDGKTAGRLANTKIERDDLLGGLIHEYRAAA